MGQSSVLDVLDIQATAQCIGDGNCPVCEGGSHVVQLELEGTLLSARSSSQLDTHVT